MRPYLTIASELLTVATVNRVMRTTYTLEQVRALPSELIEIALELAPSAGDDE